MLEIRNDDSFRLKLIWRFESPTFRQPEWNWNAAHIESGKTQIYVIRKKLQIEKKKKN